MDLYLSNFTAFLEIWVGSILLLLYNSVSLNNDFSNRLTELNDKIMAFREEYDFLPWIPEAPFNLYQYRTRYKYITLSAVIYGFFLIFYLGIEQRFPNSYPLLVATDIIILLSFLLLSFVKEEYITVYSLLSFIIISGLIVFFLWFKHESLLTFMNNVHISRSIVTIFTLFTCCFSVFLVLYIRHSLIKFQLQMSYKKLKQMDSDFKIFSSKIDELEKNSHNKKEKKINDKEIDRLYRSFLKKYPFFPILPRKCIGDDVKFTKIRKI